MDIVLLKNGVVKEIRNNKDYKKLNPKTISTILMDCHSDILGNYMNAVTLKTYEAMRKLSKVKLSYGFLPFTYTDEEECGTWEDALVRYTYRYTDMSGFMNKLNEIIISEYILNDVYWVYSAFQCYLYDDLKVKVSTKNKTKSKKYELGNFLDFLGFQEPLEKIPVLKMKKDKWYVKNKITCKGQTYVCLYGCIYVKVDKYLSTVESIKGNVTSYMAEDDSEDMRKFSMRDLEVLQTESCAVNVQISEPKTLIDLFRVPMVEFVMREISEGEGYSSITKKSFKIKYVDGTKEKISYKKLANGIFK